MFVRSFLSSSGVNPFDEVVMIIALVLCLAYPDETSRTQQLLIGRGPQRPRLSPRHRVEPFERLSVCCEKKSASRLQRARHLLDHPRLRVRLEQEQQAPREYAIELATEEVGCLDGIALHRAMNTSAMAS